MARQGGVGLRPPGGPERPVLTVSSGHSAAYLTDAVAAGRENYYSGAVAAGEPPGRWYGEGAADLGLVGFVDSQDMTAVFERFIDPRDPAFREPDRWVEAATLGRVGRRYITENELYKAALDAEPHATSERRAELLLEASKRARRNVAFHDVTFSVQKSITVLHTAFEAQEVLARRTGDEVGAEAWAQHRLAVENAIWAGNNAALDYLAAHAGYSRVGHHGGTAGRFVDAHRFVIASFFQHDSRDHDPQLHIHNAVLNRVECSDGAWRTLDSRALHRFRPAASAVAERITEAHLAHSLGVRFATRPDGKAREILGVRAEVMALFSSRRRAITAATAQLVDAFEVRFDRQPNALELDRLRRQATFATRRAKAHTGESVEERLERWDRELRSEVATGLQDVARSVLALAAGQREPQMWSRTAVAETALADVQARKSAWTQPDLTRAISDALPDRLGPSTAAEITELLDGLTAEALGLAIRLDAIRPGAESEPVDLQLADGRSAYEVPGGVLYATPAHVHTERLLVSASQLGGGPALTDAAAGKYVESLRALGVELAVDQAAAVTGILSSGAMVETLVGPAGTGKSFVVGVLAKAWTDPVHWSGPSPAVVGLASSQIATEVLTGEGLSAQNIARWLWAQRRLEESDAQGARARWQDEAWRLRPGDLVVVDESAMTATADLAAVHGYASRAGAKLLLTGDHRQLAAVGAGGGMSMLAAAGRSYELTEARRFSAAWEAEASLRLRAGDPKALSEYHKHGRLLDCGSDEAAERSAARSWLADTLEGRRTLLIVATNEQAAELSARLRSDLVRVRRVQEAGVALDRQGTTAGVGDLVQARANAWHLAGYEGNQRGPINRELLRIREVRDDGDLVVTPVVGTLSHDETLDQAMRLPADYVAHNLVLGYATTAHAAQGLSVDTAHVVASTTTSAAALYVGLSRGRESNTAHVATAVLAADAPAGTKAVSLHRTPSAVLAMAFENARPDRAALDEARLSADAAGSLRSIAELLHDAAELAVADRTAGWLDRLVNEGHLRPTQRAELAAEDGARSLSRLLRRVELAGHDAFDVLRGAITARHLEDARQLTNVIHHRITSSVPLDPRGDSFIAWLPKSVDERWRIHLEALAAAADAKTAELGHTAADQPPAWALEGLGPVPDNPTGQNQWIQRAGLVAAQREISGHDDPAVALGSPPAPGQPEVFASWRAACRALGREGAAREEAELTNGQLHLRVRAWQREQVWAPAYVADELAATSQAAVKHRAGAALRNAEAEAAARPDERDRLREEARESAALAVALEERAGVLREADQARALWYAHTASTRIVGERAADELDRRRVDSVAEPLVTAEEWLALHRQANEREDIARTVRADADLADVAEAAREARELFAPEASLSFVEALHANDAPGPRVSTTRQIPGAARVPDAEETAHILARARVALRELAYRERLEREAAAARSHPSFDEVERTAEATSELLRERKEV